MRNALALLVIVSLITCRPASAAPAAEPVVAGVVLDESDAPVKAATVKLYSVKSNWGLDNTVVETVRTDDEGRYRFKRPLTFSVPSGTDYNDHYVVAASHADHAFGWAKITASEQADTYDLVLGKPMTHSFAVADPDGKPLAGATVWINSAGDAQDSKPFHRQYAQIQTNIALAEATTDAEGQATLTNLPDTQLSFVTTMKGYAPQWTFTNRPNAKPAKVKLTPAGRVRGKVSNEAGEPVRNAIVAFAADWMHSYELVRTDDEGKYECDQLVPAGGSWAERGGTGMHKISIRHPDYCAPVRTITLDPGEALEDVDISAERGTLLRVSVKNPGTGTPVGGVRLQALMRETRLDGYTNDKGIIEWRTLPGTYTLLFISPPAGKYVTGRRDSEQIAISGELAEIDFKPPSEFKDLVTVRGTVVGTDGAPAAGVRISAMCAAQVQTPGQYGFGMDTLTNPKGEFAIPGYPAETRLCVVAETKDRKLAGTGDCSIGKADASLDKPIVLVETRPVDFDLKTLGNVRVAGAKMLVSPIVGGQRIWRVSRSVKVDEEGHLKMDGVLPGLIYHIEDARFQENEDRNVPGGLDGLLQKELQLLSPE